MDQVSTKNGVEGQVISIMFKNYDKRGSVLLMVVGLLVILGTLGGTFLLISSLDARQSKLLAGRGKAELVASGAVGKVVRALGQDLHFAAGMTTAPYTAPNTTGGNAYKNYMDHASVDEYLYSKDGDTEHLSEVFGESGTIVSTEFRHDDPDAIRDAYLVPTGEFTDDGEEYYIAVKVVDMSSLLSLNTGGEDYIKGKTDTSKILKSPALIRLKEWIGVVYSNIHKSRCGADSGGQERSITDYDSQCGRMLLSPPPAQKYRPFPISDEVYLRWRGLGRKAQFGRTFDLLSGGNVDRQMLTTMSSSRSLMRNPIAGVFASRFDMSKADALDKTDDKGDGKEPFYTQIVMLAGSDDGAGGGASQGTKLTIDNSGGGFYRGNTRWRITRPPNVEASFGGDCYRYAGGPYECYWVFDNLPQATYRVWATWGKSSVLSGASMVPYVIYTGGTITPRGMTATYSGGTPKGTAVADQGGLPTGDVFEGAVWKSLGSYSASGRLVVAIQGPQNVPTGQIRYAFADAVRIEGINMELGSGSQPAAHLTVNAWSAISEYDPAATPARAFAFKPGGKGYTVFGVQDQPFITEAFATHTTRKLNPDGSYVEDSWKWGAAIELMNFSSRVIDLKDYGLIFGSTLTGDAEVVRFPAGWVIPKAGNTRGGSLVLYDFDTGKGDANPGDVFTNVAAIDTWKRLKGLNFDGQMIRLVRIASEEGTSYTIPIDRISADLANGPLRYDQRTVDVKTSTTDPGQTKAANCRRDDALVRHRYAVAKYWASDPQVAAGHTLGSDNGVGLTGAVSITKDVAIEGFRVKVPHGLLSGPGQLSDLYLVGPIVYDGGSSPPNDLPGLLAKEYATEKSNGRANSYAKNTSGADFNQKPWNAYPRTPPNRQELAWPLLLGEVVETVPMDIERADSPNRVYGRINVNTAIQKVLELLPWPSGIDPATAAGQIISYRKTNGGFLTPGEVTLALDGFVKDNEPATKSLDRDSLYAAISGCITVNSDMFAVTVRVQLGNKTAPERSWHYLAVIDRGCAVVPTSKPAVLLFTQVR